MSDTRTIKGRTKLVELEHLDTETSYGAELIELVADEETLFVSEQTKWDHNSNEKRPHEVLIQRGCSPDGTHRFKGIRKRVRALVLLGADAERERLQKEVDAGRNRERDLSKARDEAQHAKKVTDEEVVRLQAAIKTTVYDRNVEREQLKAVRDRVHAMEAELAKVRKAIGSVEYKRILETP